MFYFFFFFFLLPNIIPVHIKTWCIFNFWAIFPGGSTLYTFPGETHFLFFAHFWQTILIFVKTKSVIGLSLSSWKLQRILPKYIIWHERAPDRQFVNKRNFSTKFTDFCCSLFGEGTHYAFWVWIPFWPLSLWPWDCCQAKWPKKRQGDRWKTLILPDLNIFWGKRRRLLQVFVCLHDRVHPTCWKHDFPISILREECEQCCKSYLYSFSTFSVEDVSPVLVHSDFCSKVLVKAWMRTKFHFFCFHFSCLLTKIYFCSFYTFHFF